VTPATGIFFGSRIAIWVVAILSLAWFPIHQVHAASAWMMPHTAHLDFGAGLWTRWDSGWFLEIATKGWGDDGSAAFFPVYPSLIGIVGLVTAHFTLVGLLVSLVACLVAFELLWRLARDRFGTEEGAERTVLYLALTPMAVFLGAVYSESTYLMLVLAAFLLAERRHWALASLAAALALLTRPTGVAVVAAVAVLAWPNRRALAWLLLVPALFAFYPLVLWIQFRQPWAFLTAEKQWSHHLSPFGPIGGLWDGTAALWRVTGNHHLTVLNAENLAYTLVYLVLLYLVWRECTLAESVFASVSLLGPMSVPIAGGPPLDSLPRYGLVIFPFYLVLARLGANRRANAAIIGISALLLGMEVVRWATFQWVS
jgi:hypothetical protein